MRLMKTAAYDFALFIFCLLQFFAFASGGGSEMCTGKTHAASKHVTARHDEPGHETVLTFVTLTQSIGSTTKVFSEMPSATHLKSVTTTELSMSMGPMHQTFLVNNTIPRFAHNLDGSRESSQKPFEEKMYHSALKKHHTVTVTYTVSSMTLTKKSCTSSCTPTVAFERSEKKKHGIFDNFYQSLLEIFGKKNQIPSKTVALPHTVTKKQHVQFTTKTKAVV